jgi:hypothetical protein
LPLLSIVKPLSPALLSDPSFLPFGAIGTIVRLRWKGRLDSMTTLQINIPDQRAAALKAYAQARGLTVEKWLEQLVEQAEPSFSLENQSPDTRPIWEVIQDNMKNVPPEDLAALPRDGASQIDHYVYGQPKREG